MRVSATNNQSTISLLLQTINNQNLEPILLGNKKLVH